MGAQFIGGFLGGVVAKSQLGKGITIGHPAVNPEFDDYAALSCEVMFTFMLCYIVLSTATVKKSEGNPFFGLCIGLTVTAGAYTVGNISGGAFNPAVGLGLPVLAGGAGSLWVYVVGDFIGAIFAAVAFVLTNPEEFLAATEEPKRATGLEANVGSDAL